MSCHNQSLRFWHLDFIISTNSLRYNRTHSSGQTLAATPRDPVFIFLGKTEVDGPRFVDPLSALLAEDPELDILGSRSRSKPDFDDAIKHFGDSTDSSNSDSRYYVLSGLWLNNTIIDSFLLLLEVQMIISVRLRWDICPKGEHLLPMVLITFHQTEW